MMKNTQLAMYARKRELFIIKVHEGGEEGEVEEYVVEDETCEDSTLSTDVSSCS